MKKLLTPENVAELLQVSVECVYRNKKALCGFYPAGIKVLRFQEEVLNGIIQNSAGLEVRVPKKREEIHRQRFPKEIGSQSSNGGAKKRDSSRQKPNRHGL